MSTPWLHTATDAPVVAVVIPVHNAARWIGETLASVVAGIAADGSAELVLVDDGSADDGMRIARDVLGAWGGPSRVVRNDRPVGVADARNQGWRSSAAPWIQFLDQDDLLGGGKIAGQVAAAAADAAVVHSDWVYWTEEHSGAWQASALRSPRFGETPVLDLLRSDFFVQIGSCLFRRAWLERVGGFDAANVPIDDVHLLQKIAMAGGRFQHVPLGQPAVRWRQHAAAQHRQDLRRFALGCFENAKWVDDHLRAAGRLGDAERRTLSDAYFFCARTLAPLDATAFERVVRRLEALGRPVLPPGPPSLRLLSRVTGYRRAERFAVTYRTRLKRDAHRGE